MATERRAVSEAVRTAWLVALLVAALVKAAEAGALCHVQGSEVQAVYIRGVDFGFSCWADTGSLSNTKITSFTDNLVKCEVASTASPVQCHGNLSPGTMYKGESTGTPGYSRTDFYTPGECVLDAGSVIVDCRTATVKWTCQNPPVSTVVIEVLSWSAASNAYESKYVYLNKTSPFVIPDPLAATDMITVSGSTAAGQENAVVKSCTPPNSGPTPPPRGYNGAAVGDPHVTTLDGITVTYLDCGDNVMLKASEAELMYQARHCSFHGEGSSTCAIALQCSAGADRLELYSDSRSLRMLIGGRPLDVSKVGEFKGKGVRVSRSPKTVQLQCLTGKAAGFNVVAHIREASKFLYFDTLVWAPSSLKGKTAGLMGAWDGDASNDIAFANGELWNPGHGLKTVSAIDYGDLSEVQRSWTVSGAASIFSRAPVKEHMCTADRRHLSDMGLSAEAGLGMASEVSEFRIRANEFCEGLGITGRLHDTCMFDFIATKGDEAFARNTVEMGRILGHDLE